MSPKKIELFFKPSNKKSYFVNGILAYDAAAELGIHISSSCGGKGNCGKCKIIIQKGTETLSSLTEKELEHLSIDELAKNVRLACQTRLETSAEIIVPLSSQIKIENLRKKETEFAFAPFPLVKKYYVHVPNPNLNKVLSDEDRLFDSLKNQYNLVNLTLDFGVIKELPIILRKSMGKVTIVTWKNEIRSIEIGDTSTKSYGIALDIGTSKLVGFLLNLNNGKVLSNSFHVNPQIRFGEDIISRITYALNGDWNVLKDLQDAVVAGINEVIDDCCEKAGVKINEIYELNLVGNTAMHHFLLGLWPGYLANSPYPPVVRKGINIKAAEIGLKGHKNSNAHFLPIIGGFVGADHVAAILASKMMESAEIVMLIDVGTNTEISLGNRDLIMTSSCASGPAFEGMSTRFGMRASNGAIERVQINPKTLETNYQTIGDVSPVGICGSAFIDALAELLKSCIISKKGSFNKEMSERTERLRKGANGWEFVVAWNRETDMEDDIVVTQLDIREIQKAKAAIRAGVDVLMNKSKITKTEIGEVKITGTFGNYIDVENARHIGLYPEFPIEKIQFEENLAGVGAIMTLLSKEYRDYAEKISEKVTYYELAIDKNFQSKYIKSLDLQ